MKAKLFLALLAFCAAQVWAADSSAKDQVTAAAKKLEEQSYSWKTTMTFPEESRWRPGPTEGKTEKGGYTHVSMTFGENTSEMAFKGEKAAVKGQDGWASVSELENAEGAARMRVWMARNFKAPSAQAIQALEYIKDLKKDGDAFSGSLSEEGVKALISLRRRTGEAPEITNPSGTAKFWVRDGLLSKYEIQLHGGMNYNGNDIKMDRTTLVEIKDVGKTKVDISEEAKKKLS